SRHGGIQSVGHCLLLLIRPRGGTERSNRNCALQYLIRDAAAVAIAGFFARRSPGYGRCRPWPPRLRASPVVSPVQNFGFAASKVARPASATDSPSAFA